MANSALVNNMSPVQYIVDDSMSNNPDIIRVYGTTEKSSVNKTGHDTCNLHDGVYFQDPRNKPHSIMEESLIYDCASQRLSSCDSEEEFDPSQPCWQHPKIRQNWKIVLSATMLLLVGLVLSVLGVALWACSTFTQGIVFLVIGVICFIPGAYHVVFIYKAVKGHRGYNFHLLPLVN